MTTREETRRDDDAIVRGTMGAEPEKNVTTSGSSTTTTVRTTTTTTTTLTASVEREPVVTGSPGGGGVGGFFAGLFGRREEPTTLENADANGRADEPTDEKYAAGLHAKLGTGLREKQDAYDKAETAMTAAQTVFESVANELAAAQERLELAKKSGLPGAAPVAETAVKMAKEKLEKASYEFQKAQKNLEAAAKAKREAEVAMAESVKARAVRSQLTSSKTDELDEEAKKLDAVIKLQRAWRRYKKRKHDRLPENIAKTTLQRVFSREFAFAALVGFLMFSSSLFTGDNLSHGRSEIVEAFRTFSALDHGYLVRGITDSNVMAELTVLRARHEGLQTQMSGCERALADERGAATDGWGSSGTPLVGGNCNAKLRTSEKEVARLRKQLTIDESIAVNKEIKFLKAELALARHQLELEQLKHEEEIEYLKAVHSAESEKLLATAQANIMEAKHEGARRLRQSQLETEDMSHEVSALNDRITMYERERVGDSLGVKALTKQHAEVVKKLKKKHGADIQALESAHRSKLAEAKAEVVSVKSKDLSSIQVMSEKNKETITGLQQLIQLAEEKSRAAQDAVCKVKGSSTMTLLVYPLIAAVAMLLGVIANLNPAENAHARSGENVAVGVPVCKRCEAAEEINKQLRSRCEFAEDTSANLRKEIKTLQEDNARVNTRLSQRIIVAKQTSVDGMESRELAEQEHRLEEENVRLTERVHDVQRRNLELAEQKEMLTVRVSNIQKKLIEEGETIKEMSDKLITAEKENFELRQVIEEARADYHTAEKKLADTTASLDSTGKERGDLLSELEDARKRLRESSGKLEEAAKKDKAKQARLDQAISENEELEQALAAAKQDLISAREKSSSGERNKVQLEAENADLSSQLRRMKSMHETQINQLQRRLKDVDAERTNLDSEQGRLLEEVVTKQEEVDQLMSEMNSLRQSEESLGKELQDLMKINESLQERLKLQGNVSTELHEKELIIVEYESDLEDLRARHEKLRSQLRSSESFREEQGVQLKARDSQIAILEEELGTIRELQVANSSRLSEQLKRLAELEMDAGRKKAAQEAAQLKLEQAETAAQKTIHALEAEITKLQEQLTVAVTDAETLRNADGMNSSRLRQESRLLEEKIEALRASEIEKGHMADEIERLERELEELRRRLAELLGQVSNMKNAPPVAESNPIDEDGKALVYDDAADELRDLKRISLLNLLYSVSFASVRDGRQWKALTLSALSDAVRPLPIKRQRDNLYYAKKRSARVLVHLAQAPVSGRIPRVGWTDADVQTLSETVGWGDAEDVWLWATRALAAISRVFQGPNAHQMYQLSGLQAALDLMRHAESDKQIQLHGARIISGLVSGELAFFAQEAPQIVSGSALETLAVTLRTFPLDARVVRAAARAVWVCVHLGRSFGQHTFVQHQVYEPLMFAMSCHTDDLKVVESCCGAVLAAAARNPDTQRKLAEEGVRDAVRDTLQRVSEVNFSGTFSELSNWLFEE